MYPVSQDYITALHKTVKERKLTGTISGSYGDPVTFTEANVLAGSLHINNRCSDSDDIILGSVYIGEMTVTLRGINFADWKYAEIYIVELLKTEAGWEPVTLGRWNVSEATESAAGIEITAYDNMARLDVTFPYTGLNAATPFQWLELIETDLAVPLEDGLEDFLLSRGNGQRRFKLYSENDVGTYRDLLFWVAQTVACFATINREGQLTLRPFGSYAIADEITPSVRWQGAKFSKFVTYYSSMSITDIASQEEIILDTGDDGLRYNLGANPFLQGNSRNVSGARETLFGMITSMYYSPFEMSRSGCPAYDLGDTIVFRDRAEVERHGVIMAYDYTFRNEYRITGYGQDPAIRNALSKTDKTLAGLSKRVNSDQIQFYMFTNPGQYVVTDLIPQNIIDIRFATMKETYIVFQAEALLDVDDDMEVTVSYIYDNSEITEYHPKETYLEGKRILSLYYPMYVGEASSHRWTVKLSITDGNGNVTIAPLNIKATIWGQGLVASDSWDGRLTASDNMTLVDYAESIGVEEFEDDAELSIVEMIRLSVEENLAPVTLDFGLETEAFDDVVYINKKPIRTLTWAEAEEYTWAELEDEYLW